MPDLSGIAFGSTRPARCLYLAWQPAFGGLTSVLGRSLSTNSPYLRAGGDPRQSPGSMPVAASISPPPGLSRGSESADLRMGTPCHPGRRVAPIRDPEQPVSPVASESRRLRLRASAVMTWLPAAHLDGKTRRRARRSPGTPQRPGEVRERGALAGSVCAEKGFGASRLLPDLRHGTSRATSGLTFFPERRVCGHVPPAAAPKLAQLERLAKSTPS